MNNFFTLRDLYMGSIIGLIIISTLFLSNYKKHTDRREYSWIFQLMIIIGLYCLDELIIGLFEGYEGAAIPTLLSILNSFLYFANMLLGNLWVHFIDYHIGYPIKKWFEIVLAIPIAVGTGILFYNFFHPSLFVIENYAVSESRSVLYYYFILTALFYLYSGLHTYYICLRKGGALKFFPVWMYLLPVIAGMLLETVTDSSFVGSCNAVAVAAVMISLKNENIFRDSLTGLYNRSYLEEVKRALANKNTHYVSGIMLDLNHFKSINDLFGHAEGDKALITAAHIFRDSVGCDGEVIRYAGDEFIVILNTWDEQKIKDCIQRINNNFDKFNAQKSKPYHLSASAGYAIFNAKTQTVSEFLNIIDKNMYDNKQKFYESHGGIR